MKNIRNVGMYGNFYSSAVDIYCNYLFIHESPTLGHSSKIQHPRDFDRRFFIFASLCSGKAGGERPTVRPGDWAPSRLSAHRHHSYHSLNPGTWLGAERFLSLFLPDLVLCSYSLCTVAHESWTSPLMFIFSVQSALR